MGTANIGDCFYYVDTVNGWFQTKAGYWITKEYAKVMTDAEVAAEKRYYAEKSILSPKNVLADIIKDDLSSSSSGLGKKIRELESRKDF